MTTLSRTIAPDDPDAARLLIPRDDVVVEAPDGAGRFLAVTGPFTSYLRTVTTAPDGSSTEVIDYRLAPMVLPPFNWFYRARLRRDPPTGTHPFWAPPDTVDARAATALGSLCVLAIVLGYVGSILTQTITYAADEFGASTTGQGATLASVRVGVLAAAALAALADHRGRRQVLLAATTAACLLSAVSAAAPGLIALGATQAVVRGLATAAAVLLTVVAAEEMPAGSRAYALSLLTMAGALGVGMTLWALPLADVNDQGWRLLYVLALVWLPLLRRVARRLPESRRFEVAHPETDLAGHGRRFWMLAASALLLNLFTAPATQLMNEFLRDDRGFSAGRISLFTILTNTPGAIGILVGGRLADTRGRRIVGAAGLIGGVGFTVLMVLAQGWPMWAASMTGAIFGAATVPAISVYGPELFPTSLRGRANGIIAVFGVAGGVVGLLVAGNLTDRWGELGPALAVLSVGPALMAVLVLTVYPETAHRELEELNPEDDLLHLGSPRPDPSHR